MMGRLREIIASLTIDGSLLRQASQAIRQLHEDRDELSQQRDMLIIALAESEKLRLKQKLFFVRWQRERFEEFLIALDQPEREDEVREKLIAAVEDMRDEEARLSEFSR